VKEVFKFFLRSKNSNKCLLLLLKPNKVINNHKTHKTLYLQGLQPIFPLILFSAHSHLNTGFEVVFWKFKKQAESRFKIAMLFQKKAPKIKKKKKTKSPKKRK